MRDEQQAQPQPDRLAQIGGLATALSIAAFWLGLSLDIGLKTQDQPFSSLGAVVWLITMAIGLIFSVRASRLAYLSLNPARVRKLAAFAITFALGNAFFASYIICGIILMIIDAN